LSEFNELLDFFNLFDSRLIFMLLYDSLSLVINAFSQRDWWGHGSKERKSIALQQLDCVACTIHQCAVFWVSYFARQSLSFSIDFDHRPYNTLALPCEYV